MKPVPVDQNNVSDFGRLPLEGTYFTAKAQRNATDFLTTNFTKDTNKKGVMIEGRPDIPISKNSFNSRHSWFKKSPARNRS